jgi:molecular chaperone GrpE
METDMDDEKVISINRGEKKPPEQEETPQETELETVEAVVEEPEEGPGPQEEVERYRQIAARAQAEMENTRKRLEREKSEFYKYAQEALIKDLLPVMDNLERAIAHGEESADKEGLLQGVRMTQEGLMSVLSKHGLKVIEAKGRPFDPNFHEAVMRQENADAPPNTVVEEVQKGYLLHDRLIRPSMVVVSA